MLLLLLLLACIEPSREPVFRPRPDLAGDIPTPIGRMRSAGIQHVCKAPEIRVGTVVTVGPPELQPSGLETHRLTLRTERTLRGPVTDTFEVETVALRSRVPEPGPGRYLLATSSTSIWATIDVDDTARLPGEDALREQWQAVCDTAGGWPDAPLNLVEP